MIASEPGRTLGLVLVTQLSEEGNPIAPGSIVMFGSSGVRAFLPDSQDTVYFFSLMLWCALVGNEAAAKYKTDTRLPTFVRNTIANAIHGPQFVKSTMANIPKELLG
jgi:hypothetical protein